MWGVRGAGTAGDSRNRHATWAELTPRDTARPTLTRTYSLPTTCPPTPPLAPSTVRVAPEEEGGIVTFVTWHA